jgi:hypothetical protein
MTVAQIARSMQLDQKALYRRVERHLRELRAELERNGIAAKEAADLISDHGVVLDFRLGNHAPRWCQDSKVVSLGLRSLPYDRRGTRVACAR